MGKGITNTKKGRRVIIPALTAVMFAVMLSAAIPAADGTDISGSGAEGSGTDISGSGAEGSGTAGGSDGSSSDTVHEHHAYGNEYVDVFIIFGVAIATLGALVYLFLMRK